MAYTPEENENFQPPEFEQTVEGQPLNKLEGLLDRVAEALIQSPLVNTTTVEANQKFIRNGQLQSGQGSGVLALFQKDIKANADDLNAYDGDAEIVLQQYANGIIDFNTLIVSINEGANDTISIEISGGGLPSPLDITEFLVQDGIFSNVSQFISISKQQSNVDVEKAEEFLDTNIFELLPTGDTRQARITRFFQELGALLPPNLPQFDLFDSEGNPSVDGRVDRAQDGTWTGSLDYSKNNSIVYAQENTDGNIDEEDAFIHRLKSTTNDTNSTKTIEDIYNTILPYLTDILEDDIDLQDDRPIYQNQSSGYLQFRNPNQGIIVRNTNQEFIEGLDPNNPTYLQTGFTITMWVKFLDKVSNGTLFNFGNPTRNENPFGFRLETFVLNKDDTYNDGNGNVETFGNYIEGGYHQNTLGLFQNTNTERFVRLQVREFGDFATGNDEGLRDSAVGMGGINKFKFNPPDLNKDDNGHYFSNDEKRLLNYTNIPEDFNEWYFICATYNPNVDEENSDFNNTNPDYWLNHVQADGESYTSFSGLGNRCKVEIISKSDLLRARGFRV